MKPGKPNRSETSTTPIAANVGRVDSRQKAEEFDFNEAAFNNADTLRLVALLHHDQLALDESGTNNAASPFDPYNSLGSKPVDSKPRKSIDDLRKLSAEITKAKQSAQKPKKFK